MLKVHNSKSKFFRLMAVALSLLLLFPSLAYAGTATVNANLRTDLSAVSYARDYQTHIHTTREPISYPGNYGEGYFRIEMVGGIFADSFIEVGTRLVGNGDASWYVKALWGVTIQCLRGFAYSIQGQYSACYESTNQEPSVEVGKWYNVELVTYNQGFWVVRVRNEAGNPFDVARVYESALVITTGKTYQSTRLTFANGSTTGSAFHHWHPSYMVWGTGFLLWPTSVATNPPNARNWFRISDFAYCSATNNVYKGYLNLSGDPRFWYAGYDNPGTIGICYVDPMF